MSVRDNAPDMPTSCACPLAFPDTGECAGRMHVLDRWESPELVRARMQCDTCQSIIHAVFDPATNQATVIIDARHDRDAESYLDA